MYPTRNKWNTLSLLAMLAVSAARASTHCEQKWDDIKAPHIVAETYHIHLLKVNTSEEYQSFMPNTKYQVQVKSDDGDTKFTRFYLTVENENRSLSHGLLELYDDEITQFSQDCPDSVVQTSQLLKDEVSTYWISPEEGSGCVMFRVSIMESPSKWYMDGSLEQRFCQDPKASIDDPGPVLPECCACDEAKYELAFEGLWSRYTHPKDFPSKPWSARFSDVIGASHTSSYRFWEYNALASEGLKEVAQNGITRVLESELKNQSEHIRTIIKARGINFPNITSKTFAMFRVDQQHHLVSLVSMIDPSPDWFVGVSGLELCLTNCSWTEHKELNLYPIDAGTDDGITYEALDAKTEPRDVIRRITTTWPADERSPFYDETAIDMNPLAKLILKRQRVYEKNCDRSSLVDSAEEACRVTQWGAWGPCSATCGRGMKQRERGYKNERAAVKHDCHSDLIDTSICYSANNFVCPAESEPDYDKCPMTEWSSWSLCTKPCGPESKTRERNFRGGKRKRKECRYEFPKVELQETVDCDNPDCEAGAEDGSAPGNTVSEEGPAAEETSPPTSEPDDQQPSDDDLVGAENAVTTELEPRPGAHKKRRRKKCASERYTQWSFWSPCSVTCGMGTKSRSRQFRPGWDEPAASPDKDLSLYECQFESTTCIAETMSCDISKELMEVICSQPKQPGRCPDDHNDNSLRYYYDKASSKCDIFHYTGCNGNMNNFRTQQECQETCLHFLDYAHLRNYKLMLSSIVTYNLPYSEDLQNIKNKRTKCEEENTEETSSERSGERKKKKKKNRKETKSNEDKVHCKVTEWSDWSPCYSCKGYRTMSRDILVHPRNGGKSCPLKLIRRQKCHKILPECDARKDRQSSNQRDLDRYHDRDDDDELSASAEEEVIHCRVTEWSHWTSCTSSCGMSQRWRTRTVAIARGRSPRSRRCPALTEFEKCRVPAC